MDKGILYGVSVGPGDPELLTLKAVRTIQACPVIAVPSNRGEKSLALSIVEGAMSLEEKEIIVLPFLMTKDAERLAESHQELAQRLMDKLDEGKDIAMLNLGDVSIYSTFSYMRELVAAAGYTVEAVAGVPSFCAVAARLGESLTTRQKPLCIIPSGYGQLDAYWELEGTKVLMKNSRQFTSIKKELERRGLKAQAVQNCGLPDEKVGLPEEDTISYYTTIVVRDE